MIDAMYVRLARGKTGLAKTGVPYAQFDDVADPDAPYRVREAIRKVFVQKFGEEPPPGYLAEGLSVILKLAAEKPCECFTFEIGGTDFVFVFRATMGVQVTLEQATRIMERRLACATST